MCGPFFCTDLFHVCVQLHLRRVGVEGFPHPVLKEPALKEGKGKSLAVEEKRIPERTVIMAVDDLPEVVKDIKKKGVGGNSLKRLGSDNMFSIGNGSNSFQRNDRKGDPLGPLGND